MAIAYKNKSMKPMKYQHYLLKSPFIFTNSKAPGWPDP